MFTRMSTNIKNVSSSDGLAEQLASLFHRLGFVALVRDPETADIIASSPQAEAELLSAEPGAVRVASARIGGEAVRVEVVRSTRDEVIELTPRQLAVAQLLARGMRNREIAEALKISTHTVRRHLESIFRRLQVPNRAAAAAELKKGRIRL